MEIIELDALSFGCGFMYCLVADILFGIANYFVEKAFKIREERILLKKLRNEVK